MGGRVPSPEGLGYFQKGFTVDVAVQAMQKFDMRTLAIGDIHGCNTALETLLKAINPKLEDEIVFLGDYIDRGPGSRQVIEILLGLKESHSPVFLRGNHEVMLLEARTDEVQSNLWQSYGGLEMLESYGANYKPDWASLIPAAHWEFIESTSRFFETGKDIFVHASYAAELDMGEQSDRMLYWEFFENLEPHKSGKRVICGHSRQASGRINDKGFAVCIDTGPANGGWLTCLDADSEKWWQANESGEVRDGKL